MKSGFTLIELLIAAAITGVLIGAALVSYRGLGTKQQVKQAGAGFVTELKNFQQKANAGRKPDDCVGQLTGYRVRKPAGSNDSYRMQPVCSTSSPEEIVVSLPEGVEFTTASFNLLFPVLGGPISGAQTIILEKDTHRYQVVVEASGVIRGEML